MKSIQTKFLILILTCVLLCAGVIGGAGIITTWRVSETDSARNMNLMCEARAGELDALLCNIEQSVGTLAVYALEQLESVDRLKSDSDYMEDYTSRLESVAVNSANNTEGALAVYVRFNPDFSPPTSGLFWSKTEQSGIFQQLTPTDFSSYSPSDVEHVGWYYIPVKNGSATWMTPYLNQNINKTMISYVIPLYKSNETVGVVGMDIDFSVIEKLVGDITVYQTGYGFLADASGNVMYHEQLPMGTQMANTDSSLVPVTHELENGTSGM